MFFFFYYCFWPCFDGGELIYEWELGVSQKPPNIILPS